MHIKQIKHNEINYQKLVELHGGIFNLPNWLCMYNEKSLMINAIYNEKNEMIGAFNLYLTKIKGITYNNTPPYSFNNGLFFINNSTTNHSKISFEKKNSYLYN